MAGGDKPLEDFVLIPILTTRENAIEYVVSTVSWVLTYQGSSRINTSNQQRCQNNLPIQTGPRGLA